MTSKPAYRVDFRIPATLQIAADLPHYGQAQEVIRTIDPLWKAEIGELRQFDIRIERGCDCNCRHCKDRETKSISIDALTSKDAVAIVERDYPQWDVTDVRLPKISGLMPDGFLAAATAIAESRPLELL